MHVGDSVTFYERIGRKGAPKCRGLAVASDMDETGGTAKFQSPTLKVARHSVRKHQDPKDLVKV